MDDRDDRHGSLVNESLDVFTEVDPLSRSIMFSPDKNEAYEPS